MAELTVLNPYAESDADDYVGNIDASTSDHGALRTITFTSYAGSFAAGEDVSFAPSGAGGVVYAWDSGTETLSYFLTVPTMSPAVLAELPVPHIQLIANTILSPAVGDSATSESGSGINAISLSDGGDTFANDGFTDLYVRNDGDEDVHVLLQRVRRCNAQHAITYELHTVAAGTSDRIGPIQKVPFNNESTGLVTVTYAGSLAVGVVGVLPVLRAPRP